MKEYDDNVRDNSIIRLFCRDCNQLLLELQLPEGNVNDVDDSFDGVKTSSTSYGMCRYESQVLTRIVVKCGECNGFSRVEQVAGKFNPGAPSDQVSFDILYGDDDAPEADVVFKAWKK